MATKKAARKGEAKTTLEVSPTITTATESDAIENSELVNEASIDFEEKTEAPVEKSEPEKEEAPAPKKEPLAESYTTVVINTSQNPIYLKGDSKEESILIAPREIKTVSKSLLRKLLRSKVVRYWFDKGILTSNYDANETTANEAVAPEHLSLPVERHDGANISASVTKFTKEGSVSINL